MFGFSLALLFGNMRVKAKAKTESLKQILKNEVSSSSAFQSRSRTLVHKHSLLLGVPRHYVPVQTASILVSGVGHSMGIPASCRHALSRKD